MGHDLNRHWQEPSPWSHPTLYATKNLLMEMDANEVCSVTTAVHLISVDSSTVASGQLESVGQNMQSNLAYSG